MELNHISHEPYEDSFEEPRPETWAASPIDLYNSEETKRQQLGVMNALAERANQAGIDLKLPAQIASFIVLNTLQRYHHESSLNHQSFSNRLHKVPTDVQNRPIEFASSYTRAMSGHALPSELLEVRESLGMPSVELAKLSHIGGIGIEGLEFMRKSVDSAIIEAGGVVYGSEALTKYNIISADALMLNGGEKGSSLGAITMTRKRYLGKLPDGTVGREKSQFILRVDENSGLDAEVARAIRSIKLEDGESWREEIQKIDRFQEAVEELLSVNDFRSAIPMATTAYAYNRDTKRLAEEKIRADRESNKVVIDLGSLPLSELVSIQGARGQSGATVDL